MKIFFVQFFCIFLPPLIPKLGVQKPTLLSRWGNWGSSLNRISNSKQGVLVTLAVESLCAFARGNRLRSFPQDLYISRNLERYSGVWWREKPGEVSPFLPSLRLSYIKMQLVHEDAHRRSGCWTNKGNYLKNQYTEGSVITCSLLWISSWHNTLSVCVCQRENMFFG